MNRRDTVLALLALSAAPLGAIAQQPGKVWRIGMLETIPMALNAANLDAFPKGMLELGHVEGRNFVIDYRSSDGRGERFPDLATELVRAKVDLIVTRGTPATFAARRIAGTIRVVSAALGEPLMFAASLARPGGNVTGLSSVISELAAKRLELLREMVPGAARIAFLANMANPNGTASWNETERAGRSFGIQTQLLDVRQAEDLERLFPAALKNRANALVVAQDGLIQANGKSIAALAAKHRLPVIYSSGENADAGGLFSYGVSYPDLYRRAASYVDRILKGANPGDLPIEQPTKFELTINRNTANGLGIKIPQPLLLRADRVIE